MDFDDDDENYDNVPIHNRTRPIQAKIMPKRFPRIGNGLWM